MATKQRMLQTSKHLPNNVSNKEAMERPLFLAKVEKGIQQADQGKTIPHAQMQERMRKWLS
jgi:hypothetical protein